MIQRSGMMLDKINLNKTISKKEYEPFIKELDTKLGMLQRKCKELGIPIVILFEGWGASGKGVLINRLIRSLDPRGFQVYSIDKPSKEEKSHPYLWRFYTRMPAKGRIHIFDRSWYQKFIDEDFGELHDKEEKYIDYDEIIHYENQFIDADTVIIKFFLHISKEEQTKRFKKLKENPDTAWRVTKKDEKRNHKYEKYCKLFNHMLIKTDTSFCPWTVVEATDINYASCKIISTTVERLETAIQKQQREVNELEQIDDPHDKESQDGIISDEIKQGEKLHSEKTQDAMDVPIKQFKNGALKEIDLSLSMEREEYKQKKRKLQKQLYYLHNAFYHKELPVILAFEGWDAAGKGGTIKRITECLDPRSYEVIPICAPNDIERKHHYLWRFWNEIPKAGHLAIFDRTWYGRVLVERIEGFCSEEEWKRAYHEMNHMEEQLYNAGYLIIKFWLHIDSEEQEKRFYARAQTPEKQWKITKEDWRNREKWSQYEEAVDDMILKTSTQYAPWIIVEANCKMYARIKVLETIVEAMEKELERS